MEISKNILGFIAAAVATFLLFIAVCIIGVGNSFNVMVFLGFLAGGLCSFLRLVDVVSSTGMMTLGFLDDKKKLFSLLIVGVGLISGGFTLIAFIWWTDQIVTYFGYDGSYFTVSSSVTFAYVCVILSGVAGLANVILGFLVFREPSVPAS